MGNNNKRVEMPSHDNRRSPNYILFSLLSNHPCPNHIIPVHFSAIINMQIMLIQLFPTILYYSYGSMIVHAPMITLSLAEPSW